MILLFKLLRWSIGALAIYAAAFVREDEEGKVQNLLERLWIKLITQEIQPCLEPVHS